MDLFSIDAEVSAFYNNAWDQQWPRSSDTIYQTEIVPIDSNAMDLDDDNTHNDDDDHYDSPIDLAIPAKLDYLCFLNISSIASALGSTKAFGDVLVVLEEYILIHRTIEMKEHVRGIVVTGHPGTGKTVFLLYLLLRRLERKLPTAVQFNNAYYVIFDKRGATVHNLQDYGQGSRLQECWALADVRLPCEVFRAHAKRVIQASSPKLDRWQEWLKQIKGIVIFSNLPKVMEIGAILKASKLQLPPSSTLSLVRKWGPSIRTIEAIITGYQDDESLEDKAKAAAQKICDDPKSLRTLTGGSGGLPFSEGSTLVFILPCRKFTENGDILTSTRCLPFIPTKFLAGLLEEARSALSNENSLELFKIFSSHSFTRPPACWHFEKLVHSRLVVGREPLAIFRRTEVESMIPSAKLLPGTLPGLKQASVSLSSFYWIPSATHFQGIDGVLCDNGDVYALQMTIPGQHRDPTAGLEKLWKNVDSARRDFDWHYVVVAPTRTVAEGYLMDNITIGGTRTNRATQGKELKMWGCVLAL